MTTLLKKILQLFILGIGLGVIAGSTIRIFIDERGEFQLTSLPFIINKTFSPIKKQFSLKDAPATKQKHNYNYYKEKTTDEITSLSERWAKLASAQAGLQASAYLLMLDDGRYAQLLAQAELPAASTIKIPILLTVLRMLDAGEITWDEPLLINKKAIGGGAGWMAYQPIGKSLPIHEVAMEMIRISDNTATNLLIQRIGGIDALNKELYDLGLKKTQVRNLLPDLNGTNTTSAKDLAHTIKLVDIDGALTPRSRDLFREIMSTSITNRLLPGGLLKGLGVSKGDPDYNLLIKGYRIYNKTGDIGITYADAGLIQMPNNSRAVAAFIVKGPFNDPRSAELIRNMAASMASSIHPISSGLEQNSQ